MDKPRFIDKLQQHVRDRRVLRSVGRQASRDIILRLESPSHGRRLQDNPMITFQDPNISPRAMELLQGKQNVPLGGGRTLLEIDDNGVAHIQVDTRRI